MESEVRRLVRHAADCVEAAADRSRSSDSFWSRAEQAIAALEALAELDIPEAVPADPAVADAVAHMRARFRQPLRLSTIADAAGVSDRVLGQRFRQHLDTTPSRYLRDLRLAAAREDLLTATARCTVAVVARRAGFNHDGRFASSYHQRYGEHPSQTLRRALAASPAHLSRPVPSEPIAVAECSTSGAV